VLKKLIVCCDGTWNTPAQKTDETFTPTNVIKIARAIKCAASDGTPQIVFYDKGVGTGNWLDRLIGGATGKGLLKNVTDAYRFLVHNYVTGDEIFLFGFSRGAYTARSTAGLIRNCGILNKRFSEKVPEALDLYRNRKPAFHPNADAAKTFRKDFSIETKIKFIGVWDTVGSLGIPISELRMFFNHNKHKFHDVQISSIIENAFHAIGVDEKRKPFKATLWDSLETRKLNMEQKWFPGVHGNVGGGYPDSDLADVTFLWMKEKAEACGLEFENNFFEKKLHPNPKGMLYNSLTLLYKLMGKHNRKIGETSKGNEELHKSTIERLHDESVEYQPENLMEYLGIGPENKGPA
jgi:uncharacterized protein (DUF2235 family)